MCLQKKKLDWRRCCSKNADGNCCYHLAGIFALLCRNPNALSRGVARCLRTDITRGREQIMENFRSWLSESSKLSGEQLETLVKQTTGDFIQNFETRASGKAVGEARLGSHTDLAVFTRREDIRVVVICTDFILRSSSRSDDLNSVFQAVFPGENGKHCSFRSWE